MIKDIVKNDAGDKLPQHTALNEETKNPFKDDLPVQEETPEEAADAEQKRKEALTERD